MDRALIGFDGSDTSLSALGWAIGEAKRHGASLTVLTVLEQAFRGDTTTVETVRKAADGFPLRHKIEHGSAAAELVRASRDADLLVVGARGRAGMLLGSVGHASLHGAHCPVALVGIDQPAEPYGRIVVGVDGSPPARRALAFAAEAARSRRAVLCAVHAVHGESHLRNRGRRLLDEELARADLDVPVHPLVVDGHPTNVLTAHSVQADLLVVGARGHTGLAVPFLGSVSDACARHAYSPVLVTR